MPSSSWLGRSVGRASSRKRERRRSGEGDCYEAAYLLGKQLSVVPVDFRVCHGIVTGNRAPVVGVRFGHAWVEMGNTVFDNSNGNQTMTPRDRYYERASIRASEVQRYTWTDTMLNALRSGHYGPWG